VGGGGGQCRHLVTLLLLSVVWGFEGGGDYDGSLCGCMETLEKRRENYMIPPHNSPVVRLACHSHGEETL